MGVLWGLVLSLLSFSKMGEKPFLGAFCKGIVSQHSPHSTFGGDSGGIIYEVKEGIKA
jgi:hypothetical protein